MLVEPFAGRRLVALDLAHRVRDALPEKMPVDIILREQGVGAQPRDELGVAVLLARIRQS